MFSRRWRFYKVVSWVVTSVVQQMVAHAYYQASATVWEPRSSGMLHSVNWSLPTFWYNLLVPPSRVKQSSWTVLWNVQSILHCKNAVYFVYLWLVSHPMVSVTHFRIHRMHVWRTSFPWDILVFNVYGSVHRKNIPVCIQQDATLHSLFISGNCSTCFGWYFHPSSGAHTTISTASGICHTVTATCRFRGGVGTAVPTPPGWRYHLKHVKQFPHTINCVKLHLVGYILEHCGVCSHTVCYGSAVVSKIRALVNTITCAYLLAHKSCLVVWEGWSNCSEGGLHPSDMSPQRHVLEGLHYNETLRHWSSMRQHHSEISQHSETWN
jgi:hypothetical protein